MRIEDALAALREPPALPAARRIALTHSGQAGLARPGCGLTCVMCRHFDRLPSPARARIRVARGRCAEVKERTGRRGAIYHPHSAHACALFQPMED